MTNGRFRQAMILVTAAFCMFYLVYRALFTLNTISPYATTISALLLLAEFYGVLVLLLFFVQVWDSREPAQVPPLEGRTVDVFVPTYNEDPQLLRATIEACTRLDYPARVYVCDDGKRPAVAALCKELGVEYFIRPDNKHAKAGNLNHAFGKTDGEFIVILDADHVPEPNYISRMLGYFADEKLGFVQTPHAFYNFDSFQARLNHKQRRYWEEGHLFYEVIQPGRNRWGCPIFAGSAVMFRRKALAEVGYIATETITEDMHTGMRCNAKGWKSLALSERLVVGQAAPDITTFHVQRLRWGEGNLSIMAYDNPLTMKGLTFMQRLCYLGSMVHWAGGLFKLIIYLTPILMMFTCVPPVNEFTWMLACITLVYLVLSIAGVNIASNGFGSFINGELFCMVNFWTQVRGTMRAVFWRKFQQFVVTSKRGRQSKSIWPFIRPQVFLMGLSVVALFWGWWPVMFRLTEDYFRPMVPSFWILFHMWLAWMVVKRALWPEDKRYSFRHVVHLPVAYRWDGTLLNEATKRRAPSGDGWSGVGVTVDLNELGVGVVAYRPLPENAVLRLTLRGAGETLEVFGTVKWSRELTSEEKAATGSAKAFRSGVAFKDLTALQIDSLNRLCLHYAIPRLYEEYAEGQREPSWRRLLARFIPGVQIRHGGNRPVYRLPMLLCPADSADIIYSATEELTPSLATVMLMENLPLNSEVDFDMATPFGEIRGAARVVWAEPHVYAAKKFQRYHLEFLRFEENGEALIKTLTSPAKNRRLLPALRPDREPLAVKVARPVAIGVAGAVPAVLLALGAFVYVCRDDFFLRRIIASVNSPTADDLARASDIYTTSMRQKHPSTDRLALLVGAMARSNRTTDVDLLIQRLAPRDKYNLDLQISLAQALDNTKEHDRAEREYQRLLADSRIMSRLPAQRMTILIAAARSSVHAGDVDRAAQRFREVLALNPTSMALRNEFAGSLLAAGRYRDAVALYEGIQPDLNGRLLLVSAHTQNKEFGEAERECRAIIAERPDDPQFQRLLADVLAGKEGGQAQSKAIYERLANLSGGDPEIMLRLAQIAVWTKHFDEALDRFQVLLRERPNDPEVVRGYVDAASNAEKLTDVHRKTALELFDRTANGVTDDPVLLARLAHVLQRLKENEKSTTLVDRALAMRPTDPTVRKNFFGALLATGRLQEVLRREDVKDIDLDTRRSLVGLALKAQNFAAAEAECRSILLKHPDDAATRRMLADILCWKKPPDYLEAEPLFEKLVDQPPTQPKEVPAAVRLAEIALWGGNSDVSLRRFQALLDRDFEQPNLWFGFAEAAAGARAPWGDKTRQLALKLADRALAQQPKGAEVELPSRNRVAWLYVRAGETAKAVALVEKMMLEKPSDPKARRELAALLGALKRPADGIRLLSADSSDADDLYELARLHIATDRYEDAERFVRKALLIRPNDRTGLMLLSDVLCWRKDFRSALALYEKMLLASPRDASLRTRAAEVTLWSGNCDGALPLFASILTDRFEQPELWAKYIDAAAGAREVAADQVELAFRIGQATGDGGQPAEFWCRVAWILLRPTGTADPKAVDPRHLKLAGQALDRAVAQQPPSPAIRSELALVLAAAKRFPEAITILERLLEASPNDEKFQLDLANVLLWSDAPDRAIVRYQALLQRPGNRKTVWPGFVDAASRATALTADQRKSALDIAAKLVDESEASTTMLCRLAMTLWKSADRVVAGRLLDRAVVQRPRDARVRSELAGALETVERFRDVLLLYEGFALSGEDRLRVARVYCAQKEFEKAEKLLREALAPPNDKDRDLRFQLAEVLCWKHDWTNGLAMLQKLDGEKPNEPRVRLRIAEATLNSGDSAGALGLFQSILAADFASPDAWRGFIDAAAAAPKLDEKQSRLAMQIADQYDAKRSAQQDFRARLAYVLWRANDRVRAQSMLDVALATLPTDAPSRRALAGTCEALGRFKDVIRLSEGVTPTADDRLRLARSYAALKSFEPAERECRAVLAADSQNPTAKRLLADVLSWNKNYAASLAIINELLQANPNDETLRLRRAEVVSWSGNAEQSLVEFSRLLREKFERPAVWPAFVDSAAAAKSLDKEQTELAQRISDALAVQPVVRPETWTRLGWIFHRAKDADRASRALDKAVAMHPTDKDVVRELAGVLLAVDNQTAAVGLLEQVVAANPADAETRTRLAETLVATRAYDKAVDQFEVLLKKGDLPQKVWYTYINAAAGATRLGVGHRETVVAAARRLEELRDVPAEIFSRLAWVLSRLGERDLAERCIDRAASADPRDPAVRKEIAGVLGALGRSQQALEWYAQLKLEPRDRIQLAGVYASAKEFAKAEIEINKLLETDPKDFEARLWLADLRAWSKQYKDALRLYRELEIESPNDSRMPVRLARVALWSQDYDRAFGLFSRILQKNVEQPELWSDFIDAASNAKKLPPGDLKLLKVIVDRGLEERRTDAAFLGRMARVMRRLNEPEKGIELLRQALAASPDSRSIRQQLAEALQANGKYEEAEKHFALLLRPAKVESEKDDQ